MQSRPVHQEILLNSNFAEILQCLTKRGTQKKVGKEVSRAMAFNEKGTEGGRQILFLHDKVGWFLKPP